MKPALSSATEAELGTCNAKDGAMLHTTLEDIMGHPQQAMSPSSPTTVAHLASPTTPSNNATLSTQMADQIFRSFSLAISEMRASTQI
jgi:hypothetical protein